MLTREQARQQLERFVTKDHAKSRLERIERLPAALRANLRLVFAPQKTNDEGFEHRPWRRSFADDDAGLRAATELACLPQETLRQVFGTVIPELAPYLLRAWEMLDHRPYLQGYLRRPFRAPGASPRINDRRASFLVDVLEALESFPPAIEWIATWAGHAFSESPNVALLLSAAIDEGGQVGAKVLAILKASAQGEHEIGTMGHHVIVALLGASDRSAWEYVEKLLLAAQRDEGLRQSILERIDEAHPDAFRHMLRVVSEHNLARFSSIVRAVDVWFGFQWDAVSTREVNQTLAATIRFLDDPQACQAALDAAAAWRPPEPTKRKKSKAVDDDPACAQARDAYLALWAMAFRDAPAAVAPAARLLRAANPEVRFVAAHLLSMLGLEAAQRELPFALADADERVVALVTPRCHIDLDSETFDDALAPKAEPKQPKRYLSGDLFERLEGLIEKAPPKTRKLAPMVWPWMQVPWGREIVAESLIHALDDRPPTRLIPHLPHMNVGSRGRFVWLLEKLKSQHPAARSSLVSLAGDASANVREAAITLLKETRIAPDEAPSLEASLTRKAADLRRGVLALLVNQADEATLASADRLTASIDPLQRQAGLELLRLLADAGRVPEPCRQRARQYRLDHADRSRDEDVHLDALTEPPAESLSFENGLGLFDVRQRTPALAPQRKPIEYVTPAAVALLKSLDELIHQHREEPLVCSNDKQPSSEARLLGAADAWDFADLDLRKPAADQLDRLALKDLWLHWAESRPDATRDKDGLEFVRAALLLALRDHSHKIDSLDWVKPIHHAVAGDVKLKLRYEGPVHAIVDWMLLLVPAQVADNFLLDALENALALVPPDKLDVIHKEYSYEEVVWRDLSIIDTVIEFVGDQLLDASPQDRGRLYRLCRWIDEPGVKIPRMRPAWDLLLDAFVAGAANEADLYDDMLRPAGQDRRWRYGTALSSLTRLTPADAFKRAPALRSIVDRCRERILEIELARGQSESIVSHLAAKIQHSGGLAVLVRLLVAARGESFQRHAGWGDADLSRLAVLSRLIRSTFPSPEDTPEAFARQIKAAGAPQEQLVELAVYAPQWAAHVEHVLGWKDLAEAVWWIHAHTKDRAWQVADDVREKWQAEIAQRTPLAAEDLLDGAVDVAWFLTVYEALGKKRWSLVYEAAKFAAAGTGHVRARLFADAMLGAASAKDLSTRMLTKRHQDAARALGLVPLPQGKKSADDVLTRYRGIQEFLRTSRQFGSQRQASEKRAAAIGMENLARTAKYPDPIRLQWAMEALACADLAKGPVTAAAGEVTVALAVDDSGMPELTISKKGKPLANIPPAAKKLPAVKGLIDRKSDLKTSASRMRHALELAMVRGDAFGPDELRDLMKNPLLAPMLARLLFVGDGVVGYPVDGGKGLRDHAARIEPIKKSEALRLAHPYDLLIGKRWSEWQKDCFARETIQPFKQIFRELYVATKAETDARDRSRRYAGHQVQPRQSLALLGGRGWVANPEQGVFRTFHDLGLTAWMTFEEGFYTPAEVEGLTLDEVWFVGKKDPFKRVHIADVPPRVFSEVMRDLDLVVSVAHRGGVDPEASASTIQMRASLLSQTSQLLALDNVRIKENHALIKGKLGEYSVHLGSAMTHKIPGGSLFIVAVHSQHRGRLFLPFADDDPRTAEVLSKVILLARDHEIKDPNLLTQIRSL